MQPESGFSLRLKELIGTQSVSAFARQVGMSESLIRKYLKGSDPGLSRAIQIADRTGTSLLWLATGQQSESIEFSNIRNLLIKQYGLTPAETDELQKSLESQR